LAQGGHSGSSQRNLSVATAHLLGTLARGVARITLGFFPGSNRRFTIGVLGGE
jgi:hypothetical protein